MPKRPPDPYLRRYRALRRQYPHLENDVLWRLAGYKPSGDHPIWAQFGNVIRPVIARIDPRKA